jgi:hypothetical protein
LFHILFQSLWIKLKGCLGVQYLSYAYRHTGQSIVSYHINGKKKSFFMPPIMPNSCTLEDRSLPAVAAESFNDGNSVSEIAGHRSRSNIRHRFKL